MAYLTGVVTGIRHVAVSFTTDLDNISEKFLKYVTDMTRDQQNNKTTKQQNTLIWSGVLPVPWLTDQCRNSYHT